MYAFIINAAAGGGRAAKVRPAIERFMEAAGAGFRVIETRSPNEASEVSSAAAVQGETVVAVGGDGSIHHVFRGLVEAIEGKGLDPTLGILPVGTGNDLARMLRLTGSLEESLQTLVSANVRHIDYGTVTWAGSSEHGRRPFINVAGIGLDAKSARLAVKLKPYIGNLCYTVSPALSVWSWKNPVAAITVRNATAEARHWQGPFVLASVANGKWVGGGIAISPGAEVDDGMLDLCLLRAVSPIRAMFILPKAVKGRHEELDEITVHRFTAMTVEVSSPVPIHLDGEPCTDEAVRAQFDVAGGRIRVLAPSRVA